MTVPIITVCRDGVRIIKLNRPEKRNPINSEMCAEIAQILNDDALNDEILITLFTGVGDYYCSGRDMKPTFSETEEPKYFSMFLHALMNYPKILVAIVNGLAVGLGVTMLAHCDIVYASDKATFITPFTALGLCPEACSSYTFPDIMGKSKAGEMLYLNHKMTTQEAYQFGLVSTIVEHQKLDELLERLTKSAKNLSIRAIKVTKHLMAENGRDALSSSYERENREIVKCMSSKEFMETVMKFGSRKNKL